MSRLHATLWLLGGFWTFWWIALTVYWWVEGSGETLSDAVRRGPVMLLGAALCLGLAGVFGALRRRPFVLRAIVAAALLGPIGVIYACGSIAVFQGLDALWPADAQAFSEVVRDLFLKVVRWMPSFISCGAMLLALEYAFDVRERETRIVQLSREADQAHLAALRFQVNPHFLFNALNAAISLIVSGRGKAAEQLLRRLADFLRSTLAHAPLEEIPLATELDLQAAYLEVEKVRFPERLNVRRDISPEAEAALVPNLLLQPLLENAVKHGVGRSTQPTLVFLGALVRDGRLMVTVENDASAGRQAAPGLGVGLDNVRRRLQAAYGGMADLSAGPTQEGGYRVRLSLPYKPAAGARRRRGTPSASATEAL